MAESRTAVDICNSALIKLGVEKITALSDSSKAAILCNERYDKIRRKLLREHWWNFAIGRVSLVEDTSSTPAWGYSKSFFLPGDNLRILKRQDQNYDFNIENGRVLSNEADLNVLYIKDIDDVEAFDDTFKEAFAYLLAADLAYPLLQSRTMMNDMREFAKQELKETKSIDAQEGTPESLGNDQWLDSRLGGITDYTGKYSS